MFDLSNTRTAARINRLRESIALEQVAIRSSLSTTQRVKLARARQAAWAMLINQTERYDQRCILTAQCAKREVKNMEFGISTYDSDNPYKERVKDTIHQYCPNGCGDDWIRPREDIGDFRARCRQCSHPKITTK